MPGTGACFKPCLSLELMCCILVCREAAPRTWDQNPLLKLGTNAQWCKNRPEVTRFFFYTMELGHWCPLLYNSEVVRAGALDVGGISAVLFFTRWAHFSHLLKSALITRLAQEEGHTPTLFYQAEKQTSSIRWEREYMMGNYFYPSSQGTPQGGG